MAALGKADDLRRFDLYDGSSENEQKLAEFIGWLGTDYTPKYSRYSKMGAPTDMPEE